MIVGKVVLYKIDYIHNDRKFGHIKLDDKKICFSSNYYNSLYIIILNDYNEGKIKKCPVCGAYLRNEEKISFPGLNKKN